MKIKILFLLVFSPMVFAVPPYLGVSVAENLAFNRYSCLSAAKKVLYNEGFKDIETYARIATVFAAYRNTNPYHYKAVVKCLVSSGVIIVTTAAQVSRNARQKAERIRYKILQQRGITRKKPKVPKKPKVQECKIIKKASPKKASPKKELKKLKLFSLSKPKNKTTTNFQDKHHKNFTIGETFTVLCRGACLQQAERSLRNSGFYNDYDFDDDGVFGRNNYNYYASIQCIINESRVIFKVSGQKSKTRDKLLETLYKKF
ncbi:hypothetical protein [Candidatus Marithrix sp. Canyon 246]|uniref:hypothetical protein n=1 Tax=Candidatus Marithrix sp. Canyon 246 TaxID=1827136 RepID=UPI00084A1AA6|nr:hypothetical protein [Candidatus Marithrix sp. Canyon 246]